MYLHVRNTGRILAVINASSYYKENGEYFFNNGAYKSKLKIDTKLVKVPNQDLDHLINEEGDIEGVYPDDVQDQFSNLFLDPTAEYDAKVVGIDASRSDKKYIQIQRTIEGQTLTAWCYVSGTLYHQYQAGEFDVGDRVVVSFARNSLDYPYAQDRVVGF